MRARIAAIGLGLALATAGCYSPDLADCVVACAGDGDCAPGQTCGSEGLCAAPALSGRCDALATPDAGATMPPDAAPMLIDLRVRIDDLGRVIVSGVGICEAAPPSNGDCTYRVRAGAELTVRADPYLGRSFDKWQPPTCKDAGPTCLFTPMGGMPVTVHAKFRNGPGEDDD